MLHDAADDDGPCRIGYRIDVEFEGVFEEAIDQYRSIVRHVHRARHVAIERALIEHDGHPTSAQHIRWTDDDGIADAIGHLARLIARHGCAAFRLVDRQLAEQL